MSTAPRWLTHEALDRLLARFAGECELIAPVSTEGEVVFLPVRSPAEICRDYVNTLVPPKEWFLPTPERLLSYRIEDGTPTLEPENVNGNGVRERIIFGIRSCDVAGLAYLERFLSGAPFGRSGSGDPLLHRRSATTLVSVVCQRPGDTCMCVCCRGGPALEHGFDWQLTELSRGWFVEIGSARGEWLAKRCADALSEPPADAPHERAARVRDTVERFGQYSRQRVPTMAAARMISTGRLGESFWDRVGERCFECGGCSFVCPTCSCFNVADLRGPGEGELEDRSDGMSPAVPGGATTAVGDGRWVRLRLRDNCILAGFIRQAGGGYPRWTCGERCLTRFFHKLSWQFHARMGAPGCTGCGRCILACLGEEGIDRVTAEITDALIGPGGARFKDARPAACGAEVMPRREAGHPWLRWI